MYGVRDITNCPGLPCLPVCAVKALLDRTDESFCESLELNTTPSAVVRVVGKF